jgi:hypothetical protein
MGNMAARLSKTRNKHVAAITGGAPSTVIPSERAFTNGFIFGARQAGTTFTAHSAFKGYYVPSLYSRTNWQTIHAGKGNEWKLSAVPGKQNDWKSSGKQCPCFICHSSDCLDVCCLLSLITLSVCPHVPATWSAATAGCLLRSYST